jgi:GT2 family glycosyltransferase
MDITKQAQPTMAVAIVNYNTREHLRACLASIGPGAARAVVVVDNASTDGSAAMVREQFPWVALHANEHNPGYGAALNQAVASCDAPYVLLLNSDTLLAPDTVARLTSYLDAHPRAAIAGPRLANPDGTLQASCYHFPTPLQLLLEESTIGRRARHVPLLRERYLRTWSHRAARPVPWVLGAALAIRRAAFDAVGGFDEGYVMYFEEVDLCYRLAAAGWQVHFAPVTTVVHAGGASTAQRRAEMAERFFVSLARFYRRHYSPRRLAAARAIVTGVVAARLARDALRLRGAREAAHRDRIAENIAAWRRVLRGSADWQVRHG